MKKRVLLIEDAKDMQLIVTLAIESICDLRCVSTLAEARAEVETNIYELILLDVQLPDGDGFEFCKDLRAKEAFADVPLIFLTGQTEISSRVMGFELGADDYVTKPLEPTEFAARVLGKLKRVKKTQTTFSQSGFRIDLKAHKIFETSEDGVERALNLTPIEFKLLNHFLQNNERVFSRQELLNLFWSETLHVSGHTVDTHISSLRKKMGTAGVCVRSVFKKGYCFSVTPVSSKKIAS